MVYKICEILNATNCSQATVTVTVGAPDILAVNDAGTANGYTGGTAVANVLVNDILNGSLVNASLVNTTFVSSSNPNVTLVGTSVAVAPGTPAGTYTLVYKICEILNATNCSQATVTVTVGAPVILAVNDAGSSVNSFTGGTSFTNVLANDLLNGAAVNPADITLTFISSTNAGVTLSGTNVVVAAGTPAGNYSLVYQICDNLNPSNCSQATVTVPVSAPAILAVNDAGSANGYTGGTAVANVLVNDMLNGVTVNPSDITVSFISSSNPNVTLVGNSVVVAPGTPAGTYTLVYQICEVVNTSNCSQATVTVTLGAPAILAVNDAGSSVNSFTGGTSFTNVLANDLLNGSAVNPSDITLTFISSTNAGVTLSGTNAVVAAGTPAGNYSLVYQICDNLNPSNCSQATVTVPVSAPAILAVNDAGSANGYTGGTAVANVLVNDMLNGVTVNPSDITVSFISSSNPNVTLVGNSVVVAPGTPAGTYTLVYQICEVVNASNCSQATVTVTVGAPVILAVNDAGSSVNSFTGGTSFTNVLANDLLNGSIVNPSDITLTFISSTNAGVTLSGTNVVVAAGTPAGNYSLVYQICDNLNPSNCSQATVTVAVLGATVTSTTNVLCNGGNNGSIDLTIAGGVAPYTVVWNNGMTGTSISGLAAGTYTATITDANGGTYTITSTITEPAQVTVSINNISQPTCNNSGLDGSLCANANGGSGAFTYAWSNGASTQCISGLGDGTYSVTVTDANGCSATSAPVSIARPVCCQVTNPGSIGNDEAHCGPYIPSTIVSIANPSGGLGTVQYVWLWNTVNVVNNGNSGWVVIPGANGPSYAPTGTITQSTYYLRCSRSTGCSSFTGESNIVSKIVNPIPAVTATSTNVSCNGGANGTATATVTSGTAPYSYSWSNGASTASISGLVAGSYSLTVTDANGCSANGSADVNQLSTVTVSINNISQPTCNNSGLDGSLCANANGGSGAFTYAWSNGASTQCISGLGDGTYSVTVTDANGCSATSAPVSIARPVCCQVTNPGSIGNDEAHCGPYIPSTIVSIANPSGGLGTVQYVWLWNTVNVVNNGNSGWVVIPGANGPSYAPTGTITQSTYYLRCSRSTGCSSFTGESNIVSKIVNPIPNVAVTANGPTTFCAGGSVTLSATGATSYLWSNGATTSSITVNASGSYSVVGTNGNGCNAGSNIIAVNVISLPTIAVTANGPTTFCAGGSVTLTATGGSSYLWSNGATTSSITVSASGSYSVVGTCAFGCNNASNAITVTVNPLPTVAVTANGPNTFCAGGSVTLTATGATSYLWSNGATTASITVNASGSYSVTGTNVNGCTSGSNVVAVTTVPLPSIAITANGPTTFCAGGSVTLTATGGVSYLWSNGATTASITVSASGNYSVVGTCGFGCTNTSNTINVVVNPLPVVTITAGGPTTFCAGGSVTLTAAGCASYLWSNGATTASITVNASGSYSVVGTNANGCHATSNTINVVVNPLPVVTITAGGSTTLCAGGSVTLTATGGTSYLWSNGATTASITVNASGSYSVVGTNANGCHANSNTINIVVNPLPVVSISSTNVSCNGGHNGSGTVSAAGSSILWSTGATTSTISNLGAGTYTVTVTTTSGCAATGTVTISLPNALALSIINVVNATTYGGTGSATASVTGGTAPYSYSWNSNPVQTTATAILSVGSYTVTVTDAKGCSVSGTVKIKLNACQGFTTVTQGGWGANCSGNNWGCYRNTNFAASFPSGLVIGACGRFIRLSSALAVDNFLPSSGTPAALTNSSNILNPTNVNNTLAGQVVALKLNVTFDANNAAFSSSTIALGNLVITNGTFAGMTVNQLLVEGNKALGGCSTYSPSDVNAAIDMVNQNYDNGTVNNGNLACPAVAGHSPIAMDNQDNTATPDLGGNLKVYPNPMIDNSTIEYSLNYDSKVTVEVYNVNGDLINRIYNGGANAGENYSVNFNVDELKSGIYFIRLTTDTNVYNQRAVIIK